MTLNSTLKKKGNKLKVVPKKQFNSPIKLDKNLKSIENRILAKLRNKQNNIGSSVTKMPSLERNNSSSNSYGAKIDSSMLSLNRVQDYGIKNNRYKEPEVDDDAIDGFEKHRNILRIDKGNRSQSIRQTVASSFNPNDPGTIMKSIQVPRPQKESHSEYDLYNSYGSSTGFSEEKRLSDRVRNKIKASFRFRDEVETADSDSLFSSKFSKFSVPNNQEATPVLKPNRNLVTEMIKKQQSENKPANFPSISKPSGGVFSLPNLK